MRRAGAPPPHAAAPPTTTAPSPSPFPQCSTDILQRMAKAVRLSGGPGKPRSLAQFADWQPQIDNELFCLTSDQFHLSKLTPIQRFQLLEVLARFFKDKVDDPHRYTYFEVIFLGREDDPDLHEQRMDVLLNFASYSLQYPVLQVFTTISQWLSKNTTQRIYSEKLVSLLVEHFIKPDLSLRMYEFLLPLDQKCPEFVTLFLVLSHRTTSLNIGLATVYGAYIDANLSYMLSQFRDEDWMAEEFANEVFPKCLMYILNSEPSDEPQEEQIYESSLLSLTSGLMQVMQGWSSKVKSHQLEYEPLFDNPFSPWTEQKTDLLLIYGKCSEDNQKQVQEFLQNNSAPEWVSTQLENYSDLPFISQN